MPVSEHVQARHSVAKRASSSSARKRKSEREPDAHTAAVLWAFEQALRFVDCGAALGWLDAVPHVTLRRLQLACEAGETWGVVFRSAEFAVQASPASLRVHARATAEKNLSVKVLKCRGGMRQRSCHIHL